MQADDSMAAVAAVTHVSSSERQTSVAIACTDCGAVYRARQWSSGSTEPIGPPSSRCSCGAPSNGDVSVELPEIETAIGGD